MEGQRRLAQLRCASSPIPLPLLQLPAPHHSPPPQPAASCLQNRLAWLLQRKQRGPHPLQLTAPPPEHPDEAPGGSESGSLGGSSLPGGQLLAAYMPAALEPRANPYPDAEPAAEAAAEAAAEVRVPGVLQKPERAAPESRSMQGAAVVDSLRAVRGAEAAAEAAAELHGMLEVCCPHGMGWRGLALRALPRPLLVAPVRCVGASRRIRRVCWPCACVRASKYWLAARPHPATADGARPACAAPKSCFKTLSERVFSV